MRKLAIVLLGILFLFPQQSLANEQENYIALGDSLAAGQTPYTQIDAGYTDLIALQLERFAKLANFSKELSFPGYRVKEVMESIESPQAKHLLEEATLITISAGANNLLPLISHKATAGTLTFNQLSANFALNEVRVQMKELLSQVQNKAPNANVYVMGYYFPYTSVHKEQKNGAANALKKLNTILEQVAHEAGANFVDVYHLYDEGTAQFLPNVSDVHPNQQGYRIMANAMLAMYSESSNLQLAKEDMPAPNPLTFEEILKMRQAIFKEHSPENGVVTVIHSHSKRPIPIIA